MAKITGKELVSETTHKVVLRAYTIATVIILVKLYNVEIESIKFLDIEFPGRLMNTGFIILICYYFYSLVINWYTDFMSFRYWFKDNDMVSVLENTREPNAKWMLNSIPLLKKLAELEREDKFPDKFQDLDDDVKDKYRELELNIELWIRRLSYSKNSFKIVSGIGKYYVIIHCLLLPVILLLYAFYLMF